MYICEWCATGFKVWLNKRVQDGDVGSAITNVTMMGNNTVLQQNII